MLNCDVFHAGAELFDFIFGNCKLFAHHGIIRSASILVKHFGGHVSVCMTGSTANSDIDSICYPFGFQIIRPLPAWGYFYYDN